MTSIVKRYGAMFPLGMLLFVAGLSTVPAFPLLSPFAAVGGFYLMMKAPDSSAETLISIVGVLGLVGIVLGLIFGGTGLEPMVQ